MFGLVFLPPVCLRIVVFITYCVFLRVIYVASFSELSFLIVPSVFSNVYSLMFICQCFLKTDRVKPKTMKLVFAVSLLSTQH